MKPFLVVPCICVAALVTACGGGGSGSGVNGTPAPPSARTNTTLQKLIVSQQFANDAVTSTATLDTGNLTIGASQSASTLTIRYDAGTQSYTVAAAGRSETFAAADRLTPAIPGQRNYEKLRGEVAQRLTLTDNTVYKYADAAIWQRNEDLGNTLGITLDAFSYGLETANSAMPRTGSASYEVDMLGFFAPLNRTPKTVSGSGSFIADLRNGAFSVSGTAYEIDLTDDYYTGTHDWRGAGLINSSANSFGGVFAYDGRDGISVAGEIGGRFYGPQAQELGAAFHAQNADGSILAGALLGRQSSAGPLPPLSVLDSDSARSFYTSQHFVLYIKHEGASDIVGAAEIFPGAFGRIDFGADNSVRVLAKLPSGLPSPTFSAANRIPAESNTRYTTYHSSQGGEDYRLILYKVGARNDELTLTYASFGRWDRTSWVGTREDVANVWFTYGVPTATGTLARTGSASYDMIVRGSGVTYADSAQYSVTGTASMSVDFNTMNYTGNLDAHAIATAGSTTINFGPLTFGGKMSDSYGFDSSLTSQNNIGGHISGGLFGPRAEEAAATFDIISGNAAGFATGNYAGIAIGKRN